MGPSRAQSQKLNFHYSYVLMLTIEFLTQKNKKRVQTIKGREVLVSFGSLSDDLYFRPSAPSPLWPPGGRGVSGVPGLECEDGGRLKTREEREVVCQRAEQAICVLEIPKGSPK